MGLLQAGLASLSTALADQWREYFYCESIDQNTLVVKGSKRVGGKSSNTKGSDNIISNGSIIAVNEGQCMLIVEQGKIVEVCAEPGEFVYDTSTEPSIFYGGLGKGILETFKLIGKRFTFGGDTAKDQRVYYFNTKEIMGNKYGTANAIPFLVVDKNANFQLEIGIRCNGEYSYKITNPLLFYTNVCANVTDSFKRSEIDSQLKSELLTALQPALATLSGENGIRYSQIPMHTIELADALNEQLSNKWRDLRGIEVASFGVNSVSANPEDEAMMKELQKQAAYKDPSMMLGATATAMNTAAANPGGATVGFMGMNVAQSTAGIDINQLIMNQQQAQMAQQQQAQAPAAEGWTCPKCGTKNTGKFCTNCGTAQPVKGWVCEKCGEVNQGNFCHNCGTPRPKGAPLYKCDKCGWEPEDPTNPPKFCPNCGDVFDDSDKQE
ncbi:MAG: SPFH domain-containing protein [Clostridia bacterium]|jgi:membrane protease subunit (stomatin/prohibitin family)|nr:SPFH domain-containing protein [Clostridia bacterium]MBR4623186.1 SPFH domain-containing protein [Clostridia bacterium]